jgi:transposase-like protein
MRNTKNQAKTQKGQNILNLDENQAREHIEKLLWPDGQPVCPHCESGDNAYRMQGKSCRPGLCRCRKCQKQFTVTVGTIFEDSHLPLSLWIKAIHLMTSSKKGMSSLQLMRNLGLGSYKTAWHLSHRIRWAMECEPMTGMLTGSTSGTAHSCGVYDISLIIPHPTQSLIEPAIAVSNINLSGQGQSFSALLGRDILSSCILIYDGRSGNVILNF